MTTNTSSPLPSDLDRLGDALHAAAAGDLARRRVLDRRRRRRTLVTALLATVVAVPGVAVAANALIGHDEVERSLPNGTLSLLGTDPRCTTVREGIEFDCVMAEAPKGELAPGDWKGTVEPTVDDSQHVNGGCRSQNGEGTHWRCYVGREAVEQQTIGAPLLGQPSLGPSAG